jgi:hypothetical protein
VVLIADLSTLSPVAHTLDPDAVVLGTSFRPSSALAIVSGCCG